LLTWKKTNVSLRAKGESLDIFVLYRRSREMKKYVIIRWALGVTYV